MSKRAESGRATLACEVRRAEVARSPGGGRRARADDAASSDRFRTLVNQIESSRNLSVMAWFQQLTSGLP
jgi:hypothetical protein